MRSLSFTLAFNLPVRPGPQLSSEVLSDKKLRFGKICRRVFGVCCCVFTGPGNCCQKALLVMAPNRPHRTIEPFWATQCVGSQPRQPGSIQCAIVLLLHRWEGKLLSIDATRPPVRYVTRLCHKLMSMIGLSMTCQQGHKLRRSCMKHCNWVMLLCVPFFGEVFCLQQQQLQQNAEQQHLLPQGKALAKRSMSQGMSLQTTLQGLWPHQAKSGRLAWWAGIADAGCDGALGQIAPVIAPCWARPAQNTIPEKSAAAASAFQPP